MGARLALRSQRMKRRWFSRTFLSFSRFCRCILSFCCLFLFSLFSVLVRALFLLLCRSPFPFVCNAFPVLRVCEAEKRKVWRQFALRNKRENSTTRPDSDTLSTTTEKRRRRRE